MDKPLKCDEAPCKATEVLEERPNSSVSKLY